MSKILEIETTFAGDSMISATRRDRGGNPGLIWQLREAPA